MVVTLYPTHCTRLSLAEPRQDSKVFWLTGGEKPLEWAVLAVWITAATVSEGVFYD